MSFLLCSSFNKSEATYLLAGPSRPATSRNCSSITSSNWIQHRVTQLVCNSFPLKSPQANTRPPCHHSTGSHPHSSVHHLANCSVPTTSAFLNQCARQSHQVARVQQWKFLVTVMREIDHGQKSWSERGTKGAGQAANATNEKYEKLEGQL